MVSLQTDSPEIALMFARSSAMESYSSLEQSLCQTFALLTGMERDVAGLVFFKIGSARARDSIIEKLIKRHFGGKYNLAWNSILRLTKQFADRRNELAHWAPVIEVGREGADHVLGVDPPNDSFLCPPNFWWRTENTQRRTINDTLQIANDFSYLSRTINVFNHVLFDPLDTPSALLDDTRTWHDRFLEPIPYPPPEAHPLYKTPPTWRNPRQASPQ